MEETRARLREYEVLNQMVAELIKYHYPNDIISVKGEEDIGIDIGKGYRVGLFRNGIRLYFNTINARDHKFMAEHFKKFERPNFAMYYYKNSIVIYARFETLCENEVDFIKRALDVYTNFEGFYKECVSLVRESEV